MKETFSTVVSVIASQHDELIKIQAGMKQMEIDHMNAQKQLMKYLADIQEENRNLRQNLEVANFHIDNFSYNIQGFMDGSKTDVITNSFSITKEIKLDIQIPELGKLFCKKMT